MRFFSVILAFGLAAGFLRAAANDQTVLDYQVVVHLKDRPAPLEARLRLTTTPPVATHNHVKRPRMVGWKVKVLPGKGGPLPAWALARVENLFYLEAPAAGILPREGGLRFNGRFCRLWQAQTPPSLGAFVYLVEVSRDLLALSYFSASVRQGDLEAVELRLTGVALAKVPAPAEEGGSLLRTLRAWGALLEDEPQPMQTENVQ